MMNPYILLAIAIAIMAAGAGGFKLGVDHEFASQAREDQHIAQAVDAATTVSAQAIAALKVKSTTITNEVQREVRTNTVYADCKLTPVGVQLANQALAPDSSFALGSGKLPKADEAQR